MRALVLFPDEVFADLLGDRAPVGAGADRVDDRVSAALRPIRSRIQAGWRSSLPVRLRERRPIRAVRAALGGEDASTVRATTVPSVPTISPVADVEEFLDYAQWVLEEVKPRVV